MPGKEWKLKCAVAQLGVFTPCNQDENELMFGKAPNYNPLLPANNFVHQKGGFLFWGIHYQAQTARQVPGRALGTFHYISLVFQVRNGLWGAAGLSHQPSSLPLIFSPAPPPPPLLYLSHPCFSFPPLPCEIILIRIHILHATRHSSLTHTCARTVNSARHSAELWFHCSVYSYCFHLLRHWLSNELEKY